MRFRNGLAAAAAAATLACGVAACGGTGANQPASFASIVNPGYPVVSVGGVQTRFCIYISTPLECALSGFSPSRRVSIYQLEGQAAYGGIYGNTLPSLLSYYLFWHEWYDSPGYYNRYLVHNSRIPAGQRNVYITRYRTRTRTTDARYGKTETRDENSSRFNRLAKFSGPGGKVVSRSYVVSHGLPLKNAGGSRTGSVKLCAFTTHPAGTANTRVRLVAFHGSHPHTSFHFGGSHPKAPSGSKPKAPSGSKPKRGSGTSGSGGSSSTRNNARGGGHKSTSKLPCG